MKKAIAAMAVFAAALAGCGAQPGNPAVYNRINNTTDCAALQAEFDQADENRSFSSDVSIQIAYMEAADNRMREVGCY